MLKPSEVISVSDAQEAGYEALTVEYWIPDEIELLEGVMADLDRGGVDYKLVGHAKCCEIWRRDMIFVSENCAIKIPFEAR